MQSRWLLKTVKPLDPKLHRKNKFLFVVVVAVVFVEILHDNKIEALFEPIYK